MYPAPASERFFNHLKLREGFRTHVYKDSLGKLTVGVGHLLTPEELEVYKEGDRWEGDLETQFREDATHAYIAGQQQARMVGLINEEFFETLGHVCFQLGSQWNKIHRKTWGFLLEKKFIHAALEAEDSKWFHQTPVRVKDFQLGLAKANMVV